jgi:hypothetical protein
LLARKQKSGSMIELPIFADHLRKEEDLYNSIP